MGAIENHSKDSPIRVLLVEDHASFRQALAFMLEKDPGFEVAEQVYRVTSHSVVVLISTA